MCGGKSNNSQPILVAIDIYETKVSSRDGHCKKSLAKEETQLT